MLLVIIFLYLLLIWTKIKIFIKVDNQEKKYRIKIYIFDFVKVVDKLMFKQNEEKIKKYVSATSKYNQEKKIINILKTVLNKTYINLLDLKIELSLKNAANTAIAVPILSSILSFIIKQNVNRIKYSKAKYQVSPIYVNKYIFHVNIRCILSIKLIDAIYFLYVIFRKRGKLHGRKSNRANHEKCYDKY